uniref:Uncharacterized protein n=1 Tax=Anguilla anguilla TaxID=7936 RepID=A0A0E9V0U5_ANGAN
MVPSLRATLHYITFIWQMLLSKSDVQECIFSFAFSSRFDISGPP